MSEDLTPTKIDDSPERRIGRALVNLDLLFSQGRGPKGEHIWRISFSNVNIEAGVANESLDNIEMLLQVTELWATISHLSDTVELTTEHLRGLLAANERLAVSKICISKAHDAPAVLAQVPVDGLSADSIHEGIASVLAGIAMIHRVLRGEPPEGIRPPEPPTAEPEAKSPVSTPD